MERVNPMLELLKATTENTEYTEVQWKPLGEVGEVLRGKRLTKKMLSDKLKFPVFHGGLEPIGYYNEYNRSGNSVMIINVGASAGTVGFSENKFWSSDGCYTLRLDQSLSSRFLYHYLLLIEFQIKSKVRRAGIPTLDAQILEKLPIPIPALPIQEKIVGILDSFTELTAELTAELEARKKQYNYYRDRLLRFEEESTDGGTTENTEHTDVQWKPLGEVGELVRGNGLQKKDFVESGFPAIHYGQIFTKYALSASSTFSYVDEKKAKKLRIAEKNDLLIATTSENDEDVLKPLAWLGGQAAISGDMMLFRHNENVKYLAYYFQTDDFQSQKLKYITGAKVRRVSKDNLYKLIIPIPPLAKQERIVSILDKFDALTNSITEGLPREIELRQKQYEYYRELLLSFPKPEV